MTRVPGDPTIWTIVKIALVLLCLTIALRQAGAMAHDRKRTRNPGQACSQTVGEGEVHKRLFHRALQHRDDVSGSTLCEVRIEYADQFPALFS